MQLAISGRQVHFYGTASDPDATTPVTVVYYLNGVAREITTANQGRFDRTWTPAYGTHTLQVVARNIGAGTANTVVGARTCRLLSPAFYNPRGTARFVHSQRLAHVQGIAYDLDRVAFRLVVRVFNNGRYVTATHTDPRNHRYSASGALHAGVNNIRVVAYNIGRGNHNRLVGLAIIRVPGSVGWPSAYHGVYGIAARLVAARGWGQAEMPALISLWNRESGWRTSASNPSGAYGIPQALPGSKMGSAGADWRTNPATQISWGLSYIRGMYGSPRAAWAHSQAQGWY